MSHNSSYSIAEGRTLLHGIMLNRAKEVFFLGLSLKFECKMLEL